LAVANTSEGLEENWILTVNGDGTGTLTDGTETSNFTWSPTDKGFKAKGDVNVTFTEDGDNIIKAKVIGVELIFERQ